MHLIALNDEKRDLLIHWLHYLIRKMELGDYKNENAYQGLKSIQEQLLHPKKIVISVDGEQSVPIFPKVTLIDDKIIININL